MAQAIPPTFEINKESHGKENLISTHKHWTALLINRQYNYRRKIHNAEHLHHYPKSRSDVQPTFIISRITSS